MGKQVAVLTVTTPGDKDFEWKDEINLDNSSRLALATNNGARWAVGVTEEGTLEVRLVDAPLGNHEMSISMKAFSANSVEIRPSL